MSWVEPDSFMHRANRIQKKLRDAIFLLGKHSLEINFMNMITQNFVLLYFLVNYSIS